MHLADTYAVFRRTNQLQEQVTCWRLEPFLHHGLLFGVRVAGKLEENSWARAAQLRGVIERLGPAYVKVAQALSTRVDLLSPPYLLEIERLQDRVPPFEDSLALKMIAAGEQGGQAGVWQRRLWQWPPGPKVFQVWGGGQGVRMLSEGSPACPALLLP
jgi:predicted unusual protein kinase regulating ubiquinone biosynthesis (AarF/ABC1/UbiB family)